MWTPASHLSTNTKMMIMEAIPITNYEFQNLWGIAVMMTYFVLHSTLSCT